MIGTQHAITPTDTREAPNRASEKSERSVTETVDALWELSVELADEAARSDIECCCRKTVSGDKEWFDPRYAAGNDADLARHRELIDRAERYFALRGDDCTGYQVVRSLAFPSLLRFEVKR